MSMAAQKQDGDRKLENAARRAWPAVGAERVRPVARRLRRAMYFHRRHF
jgi:hypothetical protein